MLAKKVTLFLVFSSLLLGSSFSLTFSNIISQKIPIKFFSASIPGVDEQLILNKTFDLVDFILTGVFSLGLFIANFLLLSIIAKRKASKISVTPIFIFLVFSFLIFIQTHFVTYSKTHVLLLVVFFEFVFLLLNLFVKEGWREKIWKLRETNPACATLFFYNGLLAGFFILLILNKITTIVILPLSFLIIMPFVFLSIAVVNDKIFKGLIQGFPGLIVLLSLFFPTDLKKLLLLGTILLIVWFFVFRFKNNLFLASLFVRFVYPASIISLFVYNPVFYLGNFDSVEEGFFLGWLQRLVNGDALYKDVAVYHPPLLVWGMYLLSQITGFTMFSARLFLHLMQILGVVIYFFFARKICEKSWSRILTLVVFLALTSTLVRNNIEIRIGIGLLSLIFLFDFFKKKNPFFVFISGIFVAVSFFVSIEVGLAIFLSIWFTINFFPVEKFRSAFHFKVNGLFLLGAVIGSFPVCFILLMQKSIIPFSEQISFYLSAFSQGYFNVPMERAISLSYFHWHIFNQYLSSNAFFWETTKLILIGSLIFVGVKRFTNEEPNIKEKLIFAISLFGLFLFRSALGRSDWYHLLFPLSISVIVSCYLIERLFAYKPGLAGMLVLALLFVFARNPVNSVFLQNQLFEIQTYGRVIGEYKKYTFPRGAGIFIGSEINTENTDKLVDFLESSDVKETIFAYPWMPELYFFTGRRNATSFDTPYAFFTEKYQRKMIAELEINNPKFVIYNGTMNFGGLTPNALPMVNKFILENYEKVISFGSNEVLKKRSL